MECWTFPSEDWCEVTPVVVNRVFAGYSKISCSRCEWPNFGSSFFQQGAGYVLHRWSEVLSRGEVAVIHCKKNYLLYKDATCHNLWPCDFTDVTAFSSLLFLALHYCFFLFIFFLLWLFYIFVYQVLFHGCVVLFQGHLSPLSAAFSGCFFSLFCPVLFWWLFF